MMDMQHLMKSERSPSPGLDGSGRLSSPSGRRSRSRSPLNGGGGGASRSGRTGSRRLFLSNIPYECDWRKMKDLIKDEVGEDCFVDIAIDRRGKNLGFGLLEFRTVDAAEKCVERLNQAEVNGRRMIVREMTRRDEERLAEVQREKSANGSGQNSSSSAAHHGSSHLPGSGSIPPVSDIPIPILQVMRRSGIEPPLSKSLFVANIAFDCDERKIKEVFSVAGKVVSVDLKRDPDGASRGFGIVEYDTEFEALQAICMFNNALLHDRALKVRFDVKADATPKMPAGVKNIGPGLGPNGEPLSHIGILQSLPELLQLISPNVFSQIFSQAGLNNSVNSNVGGGFGSALNSFGLGGSLGGTSALAALAAALASQNTPSPGALNTNISSSHLRDGGGSGPHGYLSGNSTWVGGSGGTSRSSDSCSVVVSNLPLSTSWRQLKDRFSDAKSSLLTSSIEATPQSQDSFALPLPVMPSEPYGYYTKQDSRADKWMYGSNCSVLE